MISNIESLKDFLSTPRKIIITTHQNPDGDAMGSSLGLYLYLRKKGHDVAVIAPTGYAEFLFWLPGNSQVWIHTKNPERSEKAIAECDLVCCLDFNATKRAGGLEGALNAFEGRKVMVDHHLFPDDYADHLMSDTTKSSTAELIYDLICDLGDKELVDADIATCLYVGILTDTGSFQFPITSARVHEITADLIRKGANNSAIYQRIFNSYTENRLRLLGYCIENMKIYPELNTAMISLSTDELQRFQVKTGDTEGIVNYPLKIQGINFSAFITDRNDIRKMSFRSVGSFDVNVFARNHFNGGGHANAAGGASSDTLANVIKAFEEALPNYKDQLNYHS